MPPTEARSHTEALLRQTYAIFGAYEELSPQMSDEVVAQVLDQRDPGRLADFIAQNLTLRLSGQAAGTGATAPGEAAPAGQSTSSPTRWTCMGSGVRDGAEGAPAGGAGPEGL